jgi:4-hydroxy-tetrahydrodipicolinate synthase
MGTLGQKLGHIIIPLVTPFDRKTGEINYSVVEKLVDFIIEKKYCDSIAVTGTTGEFNTLSCDERIEMFKAVRNVANGRVPLVAGAGAASVREIIKLILEAEKLEYSAAMVVAPYYCKPSQEGIFQFFESIVKSVSLDIMLYNIPLFTGVNIDPRTVGSLAQFKSIKGIKDEAGVNPTQMTEYTLVTPDDFSVYDGDDIMALCGLAQGAAGVVSGGSHLTGDKMRNMISLFLSGQNDKAREIHFELDPFFKSLAPNNRINPIPVLKAALEIAGHPVGPPRLPLYEATVEERKMIEKELKRLNVV